MPIVHNSLFVGFGEKTPHNYSQWVALVHRPLSGVGDVGLLLDVLGVITLLGLKIVR